MTKGGVDADRRFWLALILPAVVFASVCYFYPLGRVVWISFTDPHAGFENYAMIGNSRPVDRVLLTTLRICAYTAAITVGLSYLVAYVLTQAGPRTRRLMTLGVILPLWVSVLVRSFAWIALLRKEGVVNTALQGAGLIGAPLPLIWNEFGVTLGMVHTMLPYGILPLAAHMGSMDKALTAAARGMGASATQTFLKVFLPLSMPGLIGSAVLVVIFSLGFYVTPVLLGGGRILMVAEYISIQILQVLRWGIGAMLATTLVAAIALMLAALSRAVNLRQLFAAR